MSWGMNLADQLELPIYLEASKKGEGLYRKVGFETLKEKIVHRPEVTGMTEGIEVPLMVRMPSAAGGVTYEEWAKRGFPADYGLQDDYSNVTLRESRMQKMWRLCSGLLLCHKKRISTGQDSRKELK